MKPDEFVDSNQPDTDQILYYLTSAARSMLKDVDSMYGPDAKQEITHIYNWLRGDLKEGNFKEFEKTYDMALRKYPDAASELYDAMYEHAGVGMHGTYEEFMAKCTDNGMAEGIGDSIKRGLKSVKRGMQGWGGVQGKPREVANRAKNLSDKDVKSVHAAVNAPGQGLYGNGEFKDPHEHSPAGLQKRVLDREMKKRGLGEGPEKERLRHKPIPDDDKYAGMGMPSFGHNPEEEKKDRKFFKQAFAKPKQVKEDASCGATSAGAFATGAVGAAKPKKIIKRKSAVGEGIDQVDESYWDQVLQKVAKDQAERKANPNKNYEKNPLSHDKNGVYVGDKDLAGNPVKKVKEFKAPDASHPFNKRTDAELKGFVKDAPEAAASIKKRGGNSAKNEKDAVTANVIKQSRQNDPRK